MDTTRQTLLKSLPAVGELLEHPELRITSDRPRWALLEAARQVVARARQAVLTRGEPPDEAGIVKQVRALSLELARPKLRRVVNATGVIIHTNLGRAPLSARALERVNEVARGYSNLEYDLEEGARGSRHGIVEEALLRLTGAEAAMVVNNNAAAMVLALSAIAAGREVIVSRGELVEIGGSFRIPDILAQSGCILREVGTTNRTRLSDYERAITAQTGALLKVHPSNYRIIGFTGSVDAKALCGLAGERGIPVIEDLGSGCLVDLEADGLPGEPTVAQRVAAGIHLVTFSGDKLLGGPQAGVLVGRKALIAACRAHPLARAVRMDKLGLAALEGTLQSYLEHTERSEVPVVAALTRSAEQLRSEAGALREAILAVAPGLDVRIEADSSRVGGGAFPEQPLPTTVVAVRVPEGPDRLLAFLRGQSPPIIARVREEALVIDPRTLLAGDGAILAAALARYAGAGGEEGGG